MNNNIKEALRCRAQELDVALPKLMQHYAMERFLYRLSHSPVAGKFYLKGGMLLMGMGAQTARTTMDIDLLGRISNTPDSVLKAAVSIPSRDVAEVMAEIIGWLEPVMQDEPLRTWKPGKGWK